MRASALLARETRGGDEAGERERVVEQAREAGGVALQPGVTPECDAGLLRRRGCLRLGSRRGGRRWLRVVAGREGRAAPEDEALGERVGRQSIGAVQPGARRLADRIEAG
jgi:hypothetical protein